MDRRLIFRLDPAQTSHWLCSAHICLSPFSDYFVAECRSKMKHEVSLRTWIQCSPVLQVLPGAASPGVLGVTDGSWFCWQSSVVGRKWTRSIERRRELLQPAHLPWPNLPAAPGYRSTRHLSTMMMSTAHMWPVLVWFVSGSGFVLEACARLVWIKMPQTVSFI